MVTGEVDIGLRPAPFPPIIQVILVYFWVYLLVVMREVHIGLIPATLLHITMVDCTFSTKFPSRIYSKGCARRKYSKHSSRLFLISTSKFSLLFLSKNATTLSSKHTTTTYLCVSIFHIFSYLCTLWSFTPSIYTILRIFIPSIVHYSPLLHFTKPNPP